MGTQKHSPFIAEEFLSAIRVHYLTPSEKERLKEVAERLKPLPPLPQSVTKVLDYLDSPEADLEELGQFIDASFGLHLLGVISEKAPGRTPKGILETLRLLGLVQMRSIAATAAIMRAYENNPPPEGFNSDGHWRYARLTAIVAAILGRATASEEIDRLHTTGLVIHLGKLVLAHCLPETFTQLRDHKASGRWPSVDIERDILGLDHAQIGAAAAYWFGLSWPVCQAIWHHHHPAPQSPGENWELRTIIAATARVCDDLALPDHDVLAKLYALRRHMALHLQHRRPEEPEDVWSDGSQWPALFSERLALAEKRLKTSLLKVFGPRIHTPA